MFALHTVPDSFPKSICVVSATLPVPRRLYEARPERVIYGTDFPNLPYAWDREVRHLAAMKLPDHTLAAILGQNALRLFE